MSAFSTRQEAEASPVTRAMASCSAVMGTVSIPAAMHTALALARSRMYGASGSGTV